ncbi:hypothetical protein Tco_0737704 [Tanacetum coccineum]
MFNKSSRASPRIIVEHLLIDKKNKLLLAPSSSTVKTVEWPRLPMTPWSCSNFDEIDTIVRAGHLETSYPENWETPATNSSVDEPTEVELKDCLPIRGGIDCVTVERGKMSLIPTRLVTDGLTSIMNKSIVATDHSALSISLQKDARRECSDGFLSKNFDFIVIDLRSREPHAVSSVPVGKNPSVENISMFYKR